VAISRGAASEPEHAPRCRRYSQVPNTFADRRSWAFFWPYAFRVIRGVRRIQVVRLHNAAFEEVAKFEAAQVDPDIDRLVEIPVDAEERKAVAVLSQHRRADDIREQFAVAGREGPAAFYDDDSTLRPEGLALRPSFRA
jgi:hypothetical protein